MLLSRSAQKTKSISQDHEARLNSLKRFVLSRYPDVADGAESIYLAFAFAAEFHKGQKRESGEDFIEHPLSVAEILAEWELGPDLIIAALLHDVLEDAKVVADDQEPSQAGASQPAAPSSVESAKERTIEAKKRLKRRIAGAFGKDVAEIVDGLTKVDRIVVEPRNERVLESLRRFFGAAGRDFRVVLVKLADRLHNMRTLASLPDWRRKRTAKETLSLYAPLAYRFGMGQVQCELEDLAFEHLLPDVYHKLAEKLKRTEDQRMAALSVAEKAFSKRLSAAGISATITTRSKHYYSIYRKMVRQGLTIDQVLDIVGMRIIAQSDRDCYRVLGEVHSLWLPIPGTFKDYIATPKPNLYRSLHTVVLIGAGYQMEVQIRTERMHLLAERGIAAHWRYKAKADKKVLDRLYKKGDESQWVEEFITSYIEKDKGSKLLDDIKSILQSEDVQVMTPRGEIRSFPQGATLIDFAYSIHSSVGHMFVSGKVGGIPKPPDYQLKTGDVVEIITDKKARPSKDWLRFAKTPYARHAIQKWFQVENRQVMAEIGQSVIEEKLRMAHVPNKHFYESAQLSTFIHRSELSDLNDLFVKIASGKIKVLQALQAVLSSDKFEKVHSLSVSKTAPEADLLDRIHAYRSGLVIENKTSSDVVLAKCCHPIPGDPVVGYIKRGRGVAVHRIECKYVEQLLPDNIRIIRDIRWDVPKDVKFDATLRLLSGDRKGLLVDITQALLSAGIDMVQIRSDRQPDGTVAFKIDVLVSSAKQLEGAMDRLKDIEGMIELERK